MNKEMSLHNDIESFFEDIRKKLDECEIVELSFEDFIKHLPEYEMIQFDRDYDGKYELSKSSIKFLSYNLEQSLLDSEPRIKHGFFKRKLRSPIFIFKSDGDCDHSSNSYRHGLIMVRIAVAMARADGDAVHSEIDRIKKIIWDMNFLSRTEKCALFAKTHYFLGNGLDYNKPDRDYIRISLNREKLLEVLPELTPSTSSSLLRAAKDIAIADGYLERGEIRFLQDMYKALGLSARSAKPDLEKHARSNHIELKTHDQVKYMTLSELDEIDDVLGDLILEFEDF